MKFKLVNLIFVLIGLLLFSGCTGTQNAKLVPYAETSKMEKFYVLRSPSDERDINEVIKEALIKKGYKAETGSTLSSIPGDTDLLVTYQDRWMWDITMYMIRLNLEFRNPKSQYPSVAGETYRTSAIRKTAEGMVDVTLENMFQELAKRNNK